jgi:RNA polymerase sigma-70 factor, ECF subfamily
VPCRSAKWTYAPETDEFAMIDTAPAHRDFERQLTELRPKLHRYCARMTGSVLDGEDVVQEALLKAVEALPQTASIANPGGWLFRIAHHAALDFLRRRARHDAAHSDVDLDMIADPVNPVYEIVRLRLPACGPSCVFQWASAAP